MSTATLKYVDMTKWGALPKALQDEAWKILNGLAEELVGRIERNLRDRNAVAFGHLVGSYQTVRITEGEGTGLAVGSPLEYAAYVELGGGPHWPPLRPIYQWVEEKLNLVAVGVTFESGQAAPTGKGKYRFGKKRTLKRARRIYNMARAIQYRISLSGTKPRYAMRDAIASMNLAYVLRPDQSGTAMVYEIDLEKALEDLGFWRSVDERMGRS